MAGGSSKFEKIVTMIEESEKLKSSVESKAEHLADRLVPYTLAGTGLVYLFTRNVTKALAVLKMCIRDSPKRAYAEWYRVLKHGGLMLNFDANWYGHLFEEGLRKAYEEDRRAVEAMEMEDHYTCTNIDWMEEIARKMPLSPINLSLIHIW